MTIADIEQAIIDRLKTKIQGLEITGFPEKPKEYRLLHPKGALLVSYAGSTFSEPQSVNAIVQERKMEFDITVAMRHLRTHEGAYAYLDAVRIALTGYRITGCSKMYPVKEQFLSEDNGIWQYSITFTLTAPAVEPTEKETTVLLRKITATDDYDTTIIKKEGYDG
ncbi:hypothetical protein THER_1648 [Thermodesulfovibrio sp. N1]|uniref:Gp37 family protein n=1 Tax=unclassified Thermodesulfovibrio TaxID=2645936 RepID=UPI00083A27A0|nr:MULTISPECIES: Gp37 family protein [unclassified Thermodesulfovibrio]MDI1471926.1 Gp37 family protein [Thermodesulfovibrio sp. 1176]ODA43609.1 hypothetical protein THER_1648 [Thermodesulfovibrio sp. N1]